MVAFLAAALLALARGGGAAPVTAPVAGLFLQRAEQNAARPATWVGRACPGTETTLLVRAAPASPSGRATGSVGQPAIALRLTTPLAGCQVTGERLTGSAGRDAWLVHLHVPAGARPGRYEGQLVIRSGATLIRQRSVIEVLPFELMRPSKQYSITRVPVTAAQCCAPEAAELPALRHLREIGIGSLCLPAAPADRTAVEGKMQAAGLRGPVLVPGESSSAMGSASPPPVSPTSAPHVRWYVLCSEPPSAESAAAIKAGGALIACRVDDEAAAGVDLPIFDAEGRGGARLVGRRGSLAAGVIGWWRWDAGAATALENRLRCGALLWKSGLSGALVEINPSATADAGWPLRWEGIRQGVLDSRYLTTLFSLIRQVKDKDRSSPLPGKAEVAITTALNGVAEHPSPESAERVREVAISWILQLGRTVWS